jgi:hypothetical protein
MEAAVNNMFPARISAGHRSFPQLGFNRLVVREDGHARDRDSHLPGRALYPLQLDWNKKVEAPHSFLVEYTWYEGTWPSYVPDIKSAALGGYRADHSNPRMIEVGSGEAIINKHLENKYRVTGLMREEPGPVGFKPGPRWQVTPVPRDK